jgi:hypothetical protein
MFLRGSTYPEPEGETVGGGCRRILSFQIVAPFLQRVCQWNSTVATKHERNGIVDEKLLRSAGVHREGDQLTLWREGRDGKVERVGSLNGGRFRG